MNHSRIYKADVRPFNPTFDPNTSDGIRNFLRLHGLERHTQYGKYIPMLERYLADQRIKVSTPKREDPQDTMARLEALVNANFHRFQQWCVSEPGWHK